MAELIPKEIDEPISEDFLPNDIVEANTVTDETEENKLENLLAEPPGIITSKSVSLVNEEEGDEGIATIECDSTKTEVSSISRSVAEYESSLIEEGGEDVLEKSTINRQKHKRIAIIESDSDEDNLPILQLPEDSMEGLSDKENHNDNITFSTRKQKVILDSDSDDVSSHLKATSATPNKEIFSSETTVAKNKSKFRSFVDSESDDDDASRQEDTSSKGNNEVRSSVKSVTKRKSKFKSLITSDSETENYEDQSFKVKSISPDDDESSEDEKLDSPHAKSLSRELRTNKSKEQIVYTTNKKGELIPENGTCEQKSRLSALCDSESSEDERSADDAGFHAEEEEDQPNIIQPLPYKRVKPKTTKEPKPKKMTAKEAAKQRQEIKSESLRMLRESNVALPYHRPKARTLQEFLQKRSCFASSLPALAKASSPAVAIKMNKEQLMIVSKVLQEKEKEVKEFFRSESESEGEGMDNTVDNVADQSDDENRKAGDDIEMSKTDMKEQVNTVVEENTSQPLELGNRSEAKNEDYEKHGDKVIILENVLLNAENDELSTATADIEKCMSNSEQSQGIPDQKEHLEAHHSSVQQESSDTCEESENTEIYHANNEDTINSDLNIQSHAPNNDLPMEISDEDTDVCQQKRIGEPESLGTVDDIQDLPENKESSPTNLEDENEISEQQIECHDENDTDEPMDTLLEVQPVAVPENNEKRCEDDTTKKPSHVKDYDFNLDDLEDEPNVSSETDKEANDSNIADTSDLRNDSNANSGKYNLDMFIEEPKTSDMLPTNDKSLNADNLHEDSPIIGKRPSRLELLKQKLANKQPRLTGSPNEVIDLEKGVTRPNEISKLMERFMKHTSRKTAPKQVHLDIVSVTGGEIHKETVNMNVDQEIEPIAVMEVPGAKLQKLRDQLQVQMAQRRSEMWQKRKAHVQPENGKEDYEGDAASDDAEDEILDDEEEAELTDSSSEEEADDEDEEVDEHTLLDKPKKKSAFVNEEAEESEGEDDEEETDEVMNDEGAVADGDDDNENGETDKNNGGEEALPEEESEIEEKTRDKTLRRIIKPADDSDDESSRDSVQSDVMSQQEQPKQSKKETVLESYDDEDMPTPHQNPQLKSTEKTTEEKSDSGFFLTPVSYLTGLQSLNTGSKFSRGSSLISPFRMPNVPSPLRDKNWQVGFEKQLFSEPTEESNSQLSCNEVSQEDSQNGNDMEEPSTQELLAVCSGTFGEESQMTGHTQSVSNSVGAVGKEDEDCLPETCPTTQDLLGVCSGAFTGITQPEDGTQNGTNVEEKTESQDGVSTQEMLAACSGAFTGLEKPPVEANSVDHYPNSSIIQMDEREEEKHLDEHQDLMISQLIDEDEMEQFKKQFISPPVAVRIRRAKVNLDGEEVMGSGAVIDSDDENDGLEVKMKTKKQKKLTFSDDDDSSDEDVPESEEEIALCDNDEEDIEEDDKPVENVEYDSEENEIDVEGNAAPKTFKASDFFEKEAELSESDWDSADEDEKDLDDMEFEAADNEKFDEEKVKSDLEKIHMRRILDDDTREVKLLQELLLEDGELHGNGRQRQFRWKNIDEGGEENEDKQDEEQDVYLDEEESEEQWRKLRHQREMFLKEKRESQTLIEDEDTILSDSQVLTFGKKSIVKCQSNGSSQSGSQSEKTKIRPSSPDAKQPFALLNKRGSFLARNEQVLQRLAKITKVETVQQNGAVKNSKNFLFQTVSVEEKVTMIETKKRKANNSNGTPNVIKKLRISSLTPSGDKKLGNRAKQLFRSQ